MFNPSRAKIKYGPITGKEGFANLSRRGSDTKLNNCWFIWSISENLSPAIFLDDDKKIGL